MIKKVIYGLVRLKNELLDKEDYWHPRLEYRNNGPLDLLYYLNFEAKGEYPFAQKAKIPIVEMNGVPTEFSITILNYGLGLIDLYQKNSNEELKQRIIAVLEWVKKNQESDGAWRNYYKVDFLGLQNGWSSAMGQGLAISFIYRCYNLGFISYLDTKQILEQAKKFMLTDELNLLTRYGYVLQEFGGTSGNVLNGFVFALYGIRDYCIFNNNMSLFDDYVNTLKNIIHKYCFCKIWSFYNTNHVIASSFYHQLHIDMAESLYILTGISDFKNIANYWKVGKKIKYPFIFLKAMQKLINHKSITTLSE